MTVIYAFDEFMFKRIGISIIKILCRLDTFLLSFAYQSNEFVHEKKAKASVHNLNMSPRVHL